MYQQVYKSAVKNRYFKTALKSQNSSDCAAPELCVWSLLSVRGCGDVAAGVGPCREMAIHRALCNELIIWGFLQLDRCSQHNTRRCCRPSPGKGCGEQRGALVPRAGAQHLLEGNVGSWRRPRYLALGWMLGFFLEILFQQL